MTSSISTHPLRRSVWIFTVLGITLLAACGGSQEDAPATDEAQAAPTGSAPDAAESVPGAGDSDGFEPVTSRSGTEDSLPTDIEAADGTEIQAPGVAFNLPASWRNEQPSSSMRLAQASIPGDAGDGQLTVFYFGPGGGGGVEANIERWVGQVQLDAGTSPRRIRMDLEGGMVASWVEVEGTIQPSMMGAGPTEPQPGSRLQGAVVEGPQGPWFFKATGPSATLDGQRDAFFSMLRSLRPNG